MRSKSEQCMNMGALAHLWGLQHRHDRAHRLIKPRQAERKSCNEFLGTRNVAVLLLQIGLQIRLLDALKYKHNWFRL